MNCPDVEVVDKSMLSVIFKNSNIDMAGNVYLPKHFEKGKKYPAIVVVHPGGGVKEQTAGVYAKKLSDEGFIALAFDASHQGASGGTPRYLDDPMKRVGDITVQLIICRPYLTLTETG